MKMVFDINKIVVKVVSFFYDIMYFLMGKSFEILFFFLLLSGG